MGEALLPGNAGLEGSDDLLGEALLLGNAGLEGSDDLLGEAVELEQVLPGNRCLNWKRGSGG